MSRRPRSRVRGEGGYAAVLVAALAASILLPLSAMSVDVSRWYVEIERVQAAADAAALAGVTYLPDEFALAASTARDVTSRNGYTNGGNATVTVKLGEKPTQLVVTVQTTIKNSLASSFNKKWATISRSATADYNGPAPMGSPCNTFGNEPPGTAGAGPSGSVLSLPDSDAQCSTTPQFWTAIAGPDTPKSNGDQHMTRSCSSSSNDGCSGSTNDEFNPLGYFYVVRATPAAVGRTVQLQIYDAAWAEVGDNCDQSPSGTVSSNNWNDFATTDAQTRYARTANTYCPGDVNNGSGRITTTFGLREPTTSQYPPNGAPVSGCSKQFPGYVKSEVTANALRKGNSAYNPGLARTFRQWTTLCSFTVTQAGDYYLQVRTNVAPVSSSPSSGIYSGLDSTGGWTGSQSNKVFTQSGDDTGVGGQGNNRFAMRIAGAPSGSMSVSGWQAMSIYMNYTGATARFNLVRVIPAAATKTLVLSFFDVGDASQAGTIRILPPSDSNMPAYIPGCVGSGVVNGALTNCQLNNVSSGAGFNGRTQTIRIPIPNGYDCHSTNVGGCWFRVEFSFPSTGVPNDTTTWTALVSGDPVRLIK